MLHSACSELDSFESGRAGDSARTRRGSRGRSRSGRRRLEQLAIGQLTDDRDCGVHSTARRRARRTRLRSGGCFGHTKVGRAVQARKQAASDCHGCARRRVTLGDVDPGPKIGSVVPLHSKAVSRVLTGQAERRGNTTGPYLSEPDHADPGDGIAIHELGLERRRNDRRRDIRIQPVVDQQPAFHDASHDGNSHVSTPCSGPRPRRSDHPLSHYLVTVYYVSVY